MQPNVELAEAAGATVDDGVVVDERFRTSLPDVYAIGDIARFPDPTSGRLRRIEHWSNSSAQGGHLGRQLAGSGPRTTSCPSSSRSSSRRSSSCSGTSSPPSSASSAARSPTAGSSGSTSRRSGSSSAPSSTGRRPTSSPSSASSSASGRRSTTRHGCSTRTCGPPRRAGSRLSGLAHVTRRPPDAARAASAMCSASIPASARSAAGGPTAAARARRARAGSRRAALRERGQHRLAEAALGSVVLDGDDRHPDAGEGVAVDRLDRVAVDHARGDALLGERVGGAERLVQRDPRGDDARRRRRRGASSSRRRGTSRRRVEDPRVGARRAQVGDPVEVGHRADERRRLVPVARVEDGRAVRAPGTRRGPRGPSATGRPRRSRRRRASRRASASPG